MSSSATDQFAKYEEQLAAAPKESEALAGKKRSHSEIVSVPEVSPIKDFMDNIENLARTLLMNQLTNTNTRLATQAAEIRTFNTRAASYENQIRALKERNAQLESQLAAIRTALQGK